LLYYSTFTLQFIIGLLLEIPAST